MHVGFIGLQNGRRRGYLQGLGSLRNRHAKIDPPNFIGVHHDVFGGCDLEPAGLRGDLVRTGLQIVKDIRAADIGYRLAQNAPAGSVTFPVSDP
jgi:hypothetical protein